MDHIVDRIDVSLQNLVAAELTRGRHLDRGNAQPSSLGADFGRLGIALWDELTTFAAVSNDWKDDLELLNEWRNAIAHQDFTSAKLGGIMKLRLGHVRRWRTVCQHLAKALDELLRRHLQQLTGMPPW